MPVMEFVRGLAARGRGAGKPVALAAQGMVEYGIIIAVAYVVVQSSAGLAAQFLVVSLGSLLATAALCGIVGGSGPLRILFGLPARARAPAVPVRP